MRKVLIANRGEIAVRIIRACRELDLDTVAVYSEVDSQAPHVRMADEAVLLGPAPAAQSYLNIPRLVQVATEMGCDAVHPGYGFLSENPAFAQVCEAMGLTFVGPPATVMRRLAGKVEARRLAQGLGIPVVPGCERPLDSVEEADGVARAVGYPVLLKAVAGGGGKGIRLIPDGDALRRRWEAATREAQATFGSGLLYVEKFLVRPRHVEVQILGDSHGHLVHLGERDCSLQRRRQKVLEECPSPGIRPEVRRALYRAALRLARAVGYRGAGTVEFLVEGEDFYFLEVNPRIQVEHPVTEAVWGVDLVREQLLIAAGERLSFRQRQLAPRGWSLEMRICAEDPEQDFLPSPGRITAYCPPGGPGVRVDDGVCAGWNIPAHYDSLIAKLCVWAPDRGQAIARARRALGEFVVEGVKTTIPLHLRLLEDPVFLRGETSTGYLDREADL
ncbi:MAG TPA: acetyl-CoA carboxylase biotin carboxylase subunit [Firmicutes bacterium]|nr:acetyl-CoA carboxylase biotin carboxylase subunit [Bacillota bacterium]